MVQLYQDQLKLQKRRRRVNHAALWISGGGLLLAAAAYGLLFARLFDVRAVSVTGNQLVSKAEITGAANQWLDSGRWGVRRRNDLWLIHPADLSAALVAQLPRLAVAAVSRNGRHELAVVVSERQPAGLWCLTASDACYYFDKNGTVYELTGASAGYIFLTVVDQRTRTITLGGPVAEGGWLDNIVTAQEQLALAGLRTAKVVIPADSADEFDIVTDQNWPVRFSRGTDLLAQIGALAQYLKTKLTAEQRAAVQYFDLRIPDRIYWK